MAHWRLPTPSNHLCDNLHRITDGIYFKNDSLQKDIAGTDSPGCSSKDNIPPEEATSINQEDSSVTEDEVGTIKLVTVEYAEDDYDENFSEEVRYLQSLCSEETTSKQLKSDEDGMNLEEQENTRIKRKVSQIAGAESTITLSPSKSQHQKMAIFTNPLLPQKMNPGHHGRRKKKSGGAESTTTFSSPKSQHQKMAIFTNPLLPQKMNPGHQKQSGAESTTTLSPSKSQHQKMAIFTDPLLPQNITYGPQTQSGKSQHQPGIQGLEGQTTQLYVDKQVKQPSYQPLPHPRKIQTRISRNSLVSRSHKHFHSSSSQIKQIPTDIICLPAEYPEDNHTYRVPWGKVREQLAMLGLVGKIIIQTWWTYENFKMEVVALFHEKFNCSVNDFSFTFLQCLPGNQKLIKPNVSYFFKWNGTSISNLIANGALYIKIKHPLVDPNASIIIKQSINTQGDSEKMGSAPSDNQTVDIKPPTTNYSLSPTIQKSPRGAWSKFETPMHYGLIIESLETKNQGAIVPYYGFKGRGHG
ncbi:uncharacterized protein [Pyxicephalus adspersus]|uniref:uncharacterized protein n=1 Tax=Pyxicephalus adspersus TaxID=30357 RepID=UPI003B5CF7EA